jgi:TonB-dependent SusC/RagA subfamily outer membrane receptor
MRVGNLNEVGALDIESVEVVKGAAGASLYGTTAANGVIIIKTKRGANRDGVTWTARSEIGVSDLASINYDPPFNHHLQLDETGTRFCVLGTGAYGPCSRSFRWMDEIYRINNVNSDTLRSPQAVQWAAVGASGGELLNTFQSQVWPGQRYDGFAQVATPNPVLVQSLDASGRAGGVRFFVSGQYTDDRGGIKGLNGQQQRRGRVNLDYDVRQDWRISVSTLYDQGTTDNRSGGSSNGGIFGQLLRGAPGGTDYLAKDTLGRPIVRGGGAPLRGSGNGGGTFLYDMSMLRNESNSTRYLGSIQNTYTPADWATVEAGISFDNRQRLQEAFQRKGYRTYTPSSSQNFGNMSASDLYQEALNASVSGTFRRQLRPDLQGKGSVRAFFDRVDVRSNNSAGQQFVVADVYTLSNTTTNFSTGSSSSSVRNMGVLAGGNLEWKGRYILDATYRYDGSSLFGAGNRWAPFGRISAVWLASEESFWNVPGVSEFRLRASRGTAGNTPRFDAQYETYSCSATGCSLGQAGNSKLKPETTTETEVGMDFTVMDRVGVEVTSAVSLTQDQILNVPTPSSLGFSTQWQNAGSLKNNTWEVAVNLPLINRADLQWDVRGSWDRTRTHITKLNMPEYFTNAGLGSGNGSFFLITDRREKNNGFKVNRYGNIWGRRFYKSCGELPASVQPLCGPTGEYQVDNKGFVVWTGAGNSWRDGITRNLWQTRLPAAQSPWNYPLTFGHPIVDRPLRGEPNEGSGTRQILGNTLPDFRLGLNSTVTYKKFTFYALFDGTFGHDINNQAEGWGIFDFNAQSMDQGPHKRNITVETAKPVGYSWRVGGSEGAGTGGLYDILGPNNYNVEDGSYVKMREASLSYRLGPIAGTGDWTLSLVGRNLLTITNYTGMDPEIGVSGGPSGSGLVNQIDAFDFPTLRTFTFAISTRF